MTYKIILALLFILISIPASQAKPDKCYIINSETGKAEATKCGVKKDVSIIRGAKTEKLKQMTNDLSWKHKDWSVNTQDTLVRYITNGNTIHGHQFGFIKRADNCNQDILWLSWSTYEKGMEDFKGSDATVQFSVDGTQFQIEISLLHVYEFTPVLTVVAFTNFVAGEKLISLLKKGHKIETAIISPKELANKFDIPTDSFSLIGFTASRIKAKEFCEEMTTPE